MFSRKKDYIYDLFNKYRNEFLYCKKVLNSCNTKAEVKHVKNWFNSVVYRWLVETGRIENNSCFATAHELNVKMTAFLTEICEEWNNLVSIKEKNRLI